MRPFSIDIDPANVDADGLADGNSSAGATVTLDGALTSGGSFTSADGLARRFVILDLGADDQTGATYTLTGTDADGNALTEALAGPGASASVTTTSYFLTLTSIAIASPAAGSTVDIGTVDEFKTKTYPIDAQSSSAAAIGVKVTGTINYTVEETLENVMDGNVVTPYNWHDCVSTTDLADVTAALVGAATVGSYAISVVGNSYTDTAELAVDVNQPHAS